MITKIINSIFWRSNEIFSNERIRLQKELEMESIQNSIKNIKFIMAGGGYRTGSTLQYNIIGTYLENIGVGRRLGYIDDASLEEAMNNSLINNGIINIYKCHNYFEKFEKHYINRNNDKTKNIIHLMMHRNEDQVQKSLSRWLSEDIGAVRNSYHWKLNKKEAQKSILYGSHITEYDELISSPITMIKKICNKYGIYFDQDSAESACLEHSLENTVYSSSLLSKYSRDEISNLHWNHISNDTILQAKGNNEWNSKMIKNFEVTDVESSVKEERFLDSEDINNSFFHLIYAAKAKYRIKKLTDLIIPRKVVGYEKVRMGGKHDGGYICVDDFLLTKKVISLGISDDVTWDLDVVNKNSEITIYQYDYSIDNTPVFSPNFQFKKEKIGISKNGDTEIKSICDIYNIDRSSRCVLKMDIEGSEWEVLDEIDLKTLDLFSQIIIEIHGFESITDDLWYYRVERVFKKIAKLYNLVHVHANNYAPQIVCGNLLFPCVLEMTFASKRIYYFENSNEDFPGELDTPCNGSKKDYYLGDFNY